jgi:hypothetical protein
MSLIKLKSIKNEALSFDFGGRRLIVEPHAIIELDQDDFRELCKAHNISSYMTEIVAEVEAVEAVIEATEVEAPKKKKAAK